MLSSVKQAIKLQHAGLVLRNIAVDFAQDQLLTG